MLVSGGTEEDCQTAEWLGRSLNFSQVNQPCSYLGGVTAVGVRWGLTELLGWQWRMNSCQLNSWTLFEVLRTVNGFPVIFS